MVDTSTMINDGIVQSVTGWVKIIDNFDICTNDINNEIIHKNNRISTQVIGQYQNGDYCIFTCDGVRGNIKNEAGMTYTEVANILYEKGVKFAYALDGGGSAETVLGSRQLNPIYEDNEGRRIPCVIEFMIEE
jgi:exopolysaccharide biosynthesis protein